MKNKHKNWYHLEPLVVPYSMKEKLVENCHVDQRENRLRESLQTFIALHKARAVYHWEVGADTKLYPDSALGNSLCTSGCKPNLEKKSCFPGLPCPLKLSYCPGGDPIGFQVCPRTLNRFRSTPSHSF